MSQVLGFWKCNRIVLNKTHPHRSPPTWESQSKFIESLYIDMLRIKSTLISESGHQVRYHEVKTSPLFHDYVSKVFELSNMDLKAMSVCERKSFFVNIYNCLVIHGLVEGLLKTFPGGLLSRLLFYASVAYNIGGYDFSLNDIEHGILRGNKPSPTPWSQRPFLDSDERKVLVCDPIDPRIHFALNCGATSCPPIAFYSSKEDDLNNQLDSATEGFIENNVKIEKNIIKVSKLFEWYQGDFGLSREQLIEWITSHSTESLRNKLIKIQNPVVVFETYDWSLNSF